MRFIAVLFVWRTITDVTLHDDQSGTVTGVDKSVVAARQLFHVVGIGHPRDMPAIADKARRYILAESNAGIALDAGMIVIVNPAQVGEFEVTG